MTVLNVPERGNDVTWTCDGCGASINFGHDNDNVPEPLRAAQRERLIAEHVCAP